jgi:hypothetical protein
MALTRTTSSGGKNPGSAGAGKVFQASQSFFEEPFSPAADDLAARTEAVGDLVIRKALRSEEDHLGPRHNKIWQRIFIGASFQLLSLLFGKDDPVRAFSWQISALPKRA